MSTCSGRRLLRLFWRWGDLQSDCQWLNGLTENHTGPNSQKTVEGGMNGEAGVWSIRQGRLDPGPEGLGGWLVRRRSSKNQVYLQLFCLKTWVFPSLQPLGKDCLTLWGPKWLAQIIVPRREDLDSIIQKYSLFVMGDAINLVSSHFGRWLPVG